MGELARRRRLEPWVGVLLAVLAIWTIVGQWVVPPVIERAYHEQSIPLFNKLIPGRHLNPPEKYLNEWQQVFWLCVAAIVGGWSLLMIPRQTIHRLIGTATPGAIGAIRCLVFAIVLMSACWEDLASLAYLPPGMSMQTTTTMLPFHLLHRLPIGFSALHQSYTGLLIVKYAVVAFALLSMMGLWTPAIVGPHRRSRRPVHDAATTPRGYVCRILFLAPLGR